MRTWHAEPTGQPPGNIAVIKAIIAMQRTYRNSNASYLQALMSRRNGQEAAIERTKMDDLLKALDELSIMGRQPKRPAYPNPTTGGWMARRHFKIPTTGVDIGIYPCKSGCKSRSKMKLLQMFIPYVTIGAILTVFMLLVFGGDRAGAFVVTYTIGYAAVMIFLTDG